MLRPLPADDSAWNSAFVFLGISGKKSVLDVGCGDGLNSVLLAKLSAKVTGIDISPKSIELAEKRAEINNSKSATRFICSPVEVAEIPRHSFDVIWGDAILHHLIENLQPVLSRLILWAKHGALMIFSEPVNFFNNTSAACASCFP
jgi:2-polyprenyl-3-methyl-5-hydroxy-6-metoxy-1,4-benzoquinol methylase